jgi:tRNA G37 N-methylase TrmD
MKIDVLTLFPEMFAGPMDASIIQRARADRFAGFAGA